MKSTALQKKEIMKFVEHQAKTHSFRWTNTRSQVFKTLLDLDKPVTAYKLMDAVAKRYDRSIKPASVYRSLEALMELGVVAKIETANAFTMCKHPDHDHQHVFLVCSHCGHIDEITDQGISGQLQKGAEKKGFRASRQILELHGDCKTCQT